MRDSETTKKTIIKESANLFNTKGYKATSISDITKATGLTKGAIYRHFENKSDLEEQALRSLSGIMFTQLGTAIRAAKDFRSKMESIFTFFETYMDSPLYDGGCPLMNAAVEADDTNPLLRGQAILMLAKFKDAINTLVLNGIRHKQVNTNVDVRSFSCVVVANLEGGIMMSKLEGNKEAIMISIDHLRNMVDAICLDNNEN